MATWDGKFKEQSLGSLQPQREEMGLVQLQVVLWQKCDRALVIAMRTKLISPGQWQGAIRDI